jgi:hypothetical protein
VQFTFTDVPTRIANWWLVITSDDVDVCDNDPGHPVAITLVASLRDLTRIWLGDLGWGEALRSGAIELSGPERLRRRLPSWFSLSTFATVPRPAASMQH